MVMKIRLMLAYLALSACPAFATLTTDVYLSDGNTPLALRDPNVPHVYRDVMVGTRLAVIVSSDSRQQAWGTISMSWNDWAKGELTARDFNDLTENWDGSCLEAAGRNAVVTYMSDSSTMAYYFFSAPPLVRAGQWFVWDYRAKAVGTCTVTVCDTTSIPNILATTLTFSHVPSRDFNRDTIVNFKDFALFAEHWRTTIASDPNDVAAKFDLDADRHAGPSDLALFCKFWLERTDVNEPAQDPNTPSSHLCP